MLPIKVIYKHSVQGPPLVSMETPFNNIFLCHWWQHTYYPSDYCSPSLHASNLPFLNFHPLWHHWKRVTHPVEIYFFVLMQFAFLSLSTSLPLSCFASQNLIPIFNMFHWVMQFFNLEKKQKSFVTSKIRYSTKLTNLPTMSITIQTTSLHLPYAIQNHIVEG